MSGARAACTRGRSCERAFLPAFEEMVPFVTGLVALEDDPAVRIVSYVVDCDPDDARR